MEMPHMGLAMQGLFLYSIYKLTNIARLIVILVGNQETNIYHPL